MCRFIWAPSARFERARYGLEGRCSVQLSYEGSEVRLVVVHLRGTDGIACHFDESIEAARSVMFRRRKSRAVITDICRI